MKALRSNGSATGSPALLRVAVYCRVSTTEQVGGDFDSLRAQRQAAELYIASQKGSGWTVIPEHFDDPGYTGANTQRPGLTRLIAAVERGEIDIVAVYKLDRLSRSMRDFFKIFEIFERHEVAFVSISQAFDTTSAVGKMTMNVLMSFSEFERQLTSERTKDKVVAARKRGRFTGGGLVLGYDVAPEGGRLVVNAAEAERVREIFRLFLEYPSLMDVTQELARLGWTLKRWTTREGREAGGGAIDRLSLRRLLTNYIYVGKVKFGGQVYDGEHEAIIDEVPWTKVQALIAEGERGPRPPSSRCTSLLTGILRCAPCDSAMTPTWSQKGRVRYRYYLCTKAHRRGWDSCPSKSIPATEIERFVVDRIRGIARDADLVVRTVKEARRQLADRRDGLGSEARQIRRDLDKAHNALRQGLKVVPGNSRPRRQVAVPDQQEAIRALEARLAAVENEHEGLWARGIDPADLREALRAFDPVWDRLTTPEQARVVQLLVERIDYDGAAGKVAITFRPAGVRALATEKASASETHA